VTRRRQPSNPVRKGWTVQRATGLGAVAGAIGLVMLLFYPAAPEALNLPFLAVCAIAAFCGLSILWITAVDRYRKGRRGIRMAPLRAFDVSVGLLLALPALWMIQILLDDR
jgi:hypothetical protein